MSGNRDASDRKARVRAHIRAVVSRLVRTQQAGGKLGDGVTGSAQRSVKLDREQDRS